MSLGSEQTLRKIAEVSLFLAAATCLVFWIMRVACAISFVTPYMMVTTGGEEDSIFAIWKFTQHQAVYSDPHRIPFAGSYFNWGYYYFYGSIAKVWLNLLHLDIIWIPTICRLISLAFTLAAGGIFWFALRKFVVNGFFANRAMAGAWCLIATVSPLIGFWSITTRPDIGALTFETAGMYMMLCFLRKPQDRMVIASALMFYAAFAFKQSSVTMLAGTVMALLLLKRWRASILLSSIWWILVIVTLASGGPIYRDCVLFAQAHIEMSAKLGLGYAFMACLRNPFLFLGLATIPLLRWRKNDSQAVDPIEVTLRLVVLFSFCFALVTVCRLGNTHYFIPAGWAAMLCFALISERMNGHLKLAGIAVCSWLLIAGIVRGHIIYGDDYRYSNRVHLAVKEKLSHLPAPVFVSETYANLPWVQPFEPHFVLAYAYDYDRAAGVPYEDGGWEGLAGAGYFGTIVMDQNNILPAALLSKYELVDEYKDAMADYKFYRRVEAEHH